MDNIFVDTDVIIRLLTGDDPKKQVEAAGLFEAVEEGRLTLAAPDTVIADAVYVLSSPRLYHLPRSEIRALLSSLLRLHGFKVENRKAVVDALDLYASSNLDFGDTMIVASMRQVGLGRICSYEADFDRLPGITRQVPGATHPR